MTDEEYGRAWAGQQGHSAHPIMDNDRCLGWCLFFCDRPEAEGIPWAVFGSMPADTRWYAVYDDEASSEHPTESAAYAALGAAVRAVHAAVPVLRGEPAGQPAGG